MRLEQSFAARPGEGARSTALASALLRVLPVKGYVAAHRRLVGFLEADLGLASARRDELALALEAIGRVAGDYSSKLTLPLDPALRRTRRRSRSSAPCCTSWRPTRTACGRTSTPSSCTTSGSPCRRTRSALTQIKGVLPATVVERFKVEFKWLGGVTGPTRDLDVYLLKMPAYRAELPPAVRQDLEPLAAFLEARQRTAHRRLVAALDSERYRELIRSWRELLLQPALPISPPEAAPPNAGRPIVDVASERIWKVYRKALKEGRAIGPETPAGALHQLRIRCKKLRYLLEFFRSMYDETVIAPLIKRLKLLQDMGGDARLLTVHDQSRGETSHSWPWFLPEGQFLFVIGATGHEATGLHVASLDAPHERQRLLPGTARVAYASGHLLFLRSAALYAQPFNTRTLQTSNEPVPLARNVSAWLGGPAVGLFGVSPNGVLAHRERRLSDVQLVWFDRQGERLGTVGEPGPYFQIALAPDGRRVALEIRDEERADLWIMDVARGVSSRATIDRRHKTNPVWSPDSQEVAFAAGDSLDIQRRRLQGGATAESLLETAVSTWPEDWSRDGRTLLYVTANDVWALPLTGAKSPNAF